jgi:hypothetical protein
MTEATLPPLLSRKMPWFASAWLWVIIGFDALGATAFLFFNHIITDKNEPRVSNSVALFYVLDDIVTIFFVVAILRWKRWGVLGLIAKSILVFVGSYLLWRFTPSMWAIAQLIVLLVVLRCPLYFAFQRVALMPPATADRRAC